MSNWSELSRVDRSVSVKVSDLMVVIVLNSAIGLICLQQLWTDDV